MKKYFTKNEAGEYVEVEVDDASALKKSLEASREDTKAVKSKLKELEDLKAKIEAEKQRIEEEKLANEKRFEDLWKKEQKAKEEATTSLSSELEKLRTTLANKEREALAMQLVTEHITKDVRKAEIAKKEVLDFIVFEENSTKIIGQDGTALEAKDLAKTLKEKYPFLADGIDSSGGGARGSTVSNTGKKWSEMSEKEQITLWRSDEKKAREMMGKKE